MGIERIDKREMSRRLRNGESQVSIAQRFRVSPSAVSKMKKQLNLNIARTVALESAHRVAEDHLDAFSQLRKINNRANTILDDLMARIKAEKGKGSGEKKKDLREIAIKSMAEIRNQLGLQLEIMRTLYDVAQIAEFQKEVITKIGESNTCPECHSEEIICGKCGTKVNVRARIIEGLKQARALRAGIMIKP